MAAYPFALFFSAAYTESTYLLSALGAWYHLRRGEPWKSGAWGLLAGLVRPNGFFLCVPLGLIAFGIRDAKGRMDIARPAIPRWPRLLAAAMPAVGMLLFTVYLYQRTHVWFAWARLHGAWGRVLGAGPSTP
jgi:Gpi18-like mannosyltransferase